MVSFQSPFSEAELLHNQRKVVSEPETNCRKRKSHDDSTEAGQILPCKHSQPAKSFSDIELHLGTPLPSEWQRCLDIQSGAIHFYNTRTHKRTLRDPRASPGPSTPRDYGHMSLDLELNLPYGSPTYEKPNPMKNEKSSKSTTCATYLFMGASSEEKSGSSETMETVQVMETEMVATVCMKCHMLVMLCKSSPTCPNCKFMHPPYQTSANQNVKLPRGRASCHPRNGLVILNLPMRAIWSDDHKGEGSALPTLIQSGISKRPSTSKLSSE